MNEAHNYFFYNRLVSGLLSSTGYIMNCVYLFLHFAFAPQAFPNSIKELFLLLRTGSVIRFESGEELLFLGWEQCTTLEMLVDFIHLAGQHASSQREHAAQTATTHVAAVAATETGQTHAKRLALTHSLTVDQVHNLDLRHERVQKV